MTAKTKFVRFMALLLVLAILIPAILYFFLRSRGNEENREQALLIAGSAYDIITAELTEPIVASETIAAGSSLIEDLQRENSIRENRFIREMTDFLTGIKEKFGFSSAFVVSESTKRYYTDKGVNRIVNPTGNARDIWYSLFKNSEQEYELNVDKDEEDGSSWEIFVNTRVVDQYDRFLGVCGVSIPLSRLQERFAAEEAMHDVEISVVDQTGLVLADTDNSRIKMTYLSTYRLSPDNPDFIYTRNGLNGFAVTRYLPDYGGYLVIRSGMDFGDHTSDLIYFLVSLIVLIGGLFLLGFHANRIRFDGYNERAKGQPIDALTGLPNRNYFKETYGERGIFNTTRYRSIAVFDIDFFKEANETINGDVVLLEVVRTAKELIQEKGVILRWGGDEFTVLLEPSIDESYALCREFCKNVEAEGKVTVSVGLTEVRLSDTIKKNYYRAAQGCYIVKEMGGNGVRKG